jgi:hypothetical protein
MNLELILPLFIIFCAVIGGVIAYVTGESLLIGAGLGGLLGISPLFFLGIVYLFLQKWGPDRPNCICGQCTSEDYDYIDSASNFKEHVYFYKCPHCSREYREHGKRFELNTPEGLRPYMKLSKWSRWVKDNSK